MTLPKISIVTPSFNQGKYIEQTIQSVLDQGYPNLEYIIMDGGSKDESVSIIQKYEKHLKYWVSEPDRGQSHAINKGLAQCTGRVFNWLNSDDFLEPGALFTIGETFAEKNFTALCGHVNVWDDTIFSHVRKPSFIGPSTEDSIASFNINQEGTWWNLATIQQLQGVNEQLHYCMDLDLWFRVLLSAPIHTFHTTPQILSNFRRHAQAKSTAQGRKMHNSPFVIEQALLFEHMKPQHTSWNYYDVLGVDSNTKNKAAISYANLTNPQKERITNKRLFHIAKESFYQNEHTKAQNALSKLSYWSKGVAMRDLFFLKRQLSKANTH